MMTVKLRRVLNGLSKAILFLAFYVSGYAMCNIEAGIKAQDQEEKIAILAHETLKQQTEIDSLKDQIKAHDNGLRAIHDLEARVTELKASVDHLGALHKN